MVRKHILLYAFSIFIAVSPLMPAPSVSAISGSQFNAGRIIDDSLFFNGQAMSASQVQSFLDKKGTSCTEGKCLKTFKQDTPKTPSESGLCSSMSAKDDRSAANIIYSVGKACGISQKVLMVLIQKESSLLTANDPASWRYKSATGFACFDGIPCSSGYAGFFNQVFSAARQFKLYAKYPANYNYRAQRNNYIQYNPDPSCGGSTVYIQNQATAGLYTYTPYQPNKATLKVGLGVEAPCGAYGNKNFWWLYTAWFGPTTGVDKYTRFIECSDRDFIIERGIRRKREVTDYGKFGLGIKGVNYVKNDSACQYPTYSLKIDMQIASRTTGKPYVLDESRAVYVQDTLVMRAWGLKRKQKNLPNLNGNTINALVEVSGKLDKLVRSENTDKVYIAERGWRHYLIDSEQEDPSPSLQLITGYDSMNIGNYSSTMVKRLRAGKNMDYVFTVGSEVYLLNHENIIQIDPAYVNKGWNKLVDTSDAPKLTNYDLVNARGRGPVLKNGFRRDSSYYRVNLDGSLEETTNISDAQAWGVESTPVTTRLLRNKLTNQQD